LTTAPAKLRWALALFLVWVVVSGFMLFHTGGRHFGVFAESDNWTPVSLDAVSYGLSQKTGFQLIHVFEDGCACNSRAEKHIHKLASEAGLHVQEQRFVAPEQIAADGLQLPATPAVLIFKAGKMIYAGPYASDVSCSVDNSLVLPILKQQVILPGLWLNGESNACRCATNWRDIEV